MYWISFFGTVKRKRWFSLPDMADLADPCKNRSFWAILGMIVASCESKQQQYRQTLGETSAKKWDQVLNRQQIHRGYAHLWDVKPILQVSILTPTYSIVILCYMMSNDMNINRCQYIAMWYAGIPIFMVVINTVYVYITGWWFQPLWKILVNGKDDIPYIMENKKCSKPPTRYIYIYQVHINTWSIPRLLRLAGDRTRWKRGDRSHQTTRGDRRKVTSCTEKPKTPGTKRMR